MKLTTADRQRIQVVLTALGFDTRGTDGTFGPRSREMIAAWQRARKRQATGYLAAAEHQALLRESPPNPSPSAPPPEEEATLPVVPPAALAAPEAPPVIVTTYAGSLSGFATGGGPASLAPIEADLRLTGRQFSGRLVHPVCGTLPLSLAVDAAGAITGNLRLYEAAGCAINAASANGRLSGSTLSLELRSADVSFRGTLSSRIPASPAAATRPSGLRTDVP